MGKGHSKGVSVIHSRNVVAIERRIREAKTALLEAMAECYPKGAFVFFRMMSSQVTASSCGRVLTHDDDGRVAIIMRKKGTVVRVPHGQIARIVPDPDGPPMTKTAEGFAHEACIAEDERDFESLVETLESRGN